MKQQTLIAGIALLAPACALALGERAAREWAEDIAYFQDTLEDKHIDLYHSIDRSN